MEIEQVTKQIAGLFTVAQQQQATAQKQQETVSTLVSEARTVTSALQTTARQNATLPQAVGNEMTKATQHMEETLSKSLTTALQGEMVNTGKDAVRLTADGLNSAMDEVRKSAEATVRAAKQAETTIRNSAKWMTWRWAEITIACLVIILAIPSIYSVWLYRTIQEQRETIDILSKKGGRIVLSMCGSQNDRLCVEVNADPNQDIGRIWFTNDRKHRYVIPKGY